jgi:hypothetical protein
VTKNHRCLGSIWAYAGVIYEYHANHPNLDKTNKICPRSTWPTAKS